MAQEVKSRAQSQRFVTELYRQNHEFFSGELAQGALRSLNQSFPHTWAYVAGLQNAVDERATHIRFRVNGERLVFEHNGNPFTGENVKSLCTQGLSSKGVGTVGFMGVGFKSVFYSFQKVVVTSVNPSSSALDDPLWSFSLKVPFTIIPSNYKERIRDWIGAVLPVWEDDAEPPAPGMTCRFVFE